MPWTWMKPSTGCRGSTARPANWRSNSSLPPGQMSPASVCSDMPWKWRMPPALGLNIAYEQVPLLKGALKYATLKAFAGGLLDNEFVFWPAGGIRIRGWMTSPAWCCSIRRPAAVLLLGVPADKLDVACQTGPRAAAGHLDDRARAGRPRDSSRITAAGRPYCRIA